MKVLKEILSYVIIIAVVVVIRIFIVSPVRVDGNSMYPTLKNNDILISKKFDKSIDRFDLAIIKYKNEKIVKRIIGLPGEKIRISVTKVGPNFVSRIIINGETLEENYGYESINDAGIASSEILLGDDEYFVLGDNRNNSLDSRFIGVIKKNKICGLTDFRLFPFKSFGKIK